MMYLTFYIIQYIFKVKLTFFAQHFYISIIHFYLYKVAYFILLIVVVVFFFNIDLFDMR